MTKKEKTIKQIKKLMKEYEISFEELCAPTKPMQFDLVCEINGKLQRMSFEEGKNNNPIAIFPFSEDEEACWRNIYWHFQEEAIPRLQTRHWALPTVRFYDKLFGVKNELNAALTELGKPTFAPGKVYYAQEDYPMPRINWIVGYREGDRYLRADWYGDEEPGLARYVGSINSN